LLTPCIFVANQVVKVINKIYDPQVVNNIHFC